MSITIDIMIISSYVGDDIYLDRYTTTLWNLGGVGCSGIIPFSRNTIISLVRIMV